MSQGTSKDTSGSTLDPRSLYYEFMHPSAGLSEADVDKIDPYVRAALIENKRNGLVLAVRARWVALAVTAIWVPIFNPTLESLFYEATILIFAFIGWLQLRSGSVARSRRELVLIFADLALLTFIMLYPSPLRVDVWPTAYQYQLSDFSYFYIFLAVGTLAYSWRTLIAFAIWTTALWTIGLIWVTYFGHVIPVLSENTLLAFAGYDRILETIDPNDILLHDRIQEIIIFVIVAGILAVNGQRNTRLVYQQAGVARERANLARHFAPTIVDQMAEQDEPLGDVRSQEVAVMFVDIVGFTHLAEQQNPTETVALLRQFHSRLEAQVFEHHGTLDKFLGDGLMATFGTPSASPQDAANALTCGQAILRDIHAWNQERQAQGEDPVKVSVGIHFGPVILGDIGSERRLEYAVLGDTVNVASRLEALTRQLGCGLVVSDALKSASEQSPEEKKAAALTPMTSAGPQNIRGRQEPLSVWTA